MMDSSPLLCVLETSADVAVWRAQHAVDFDGTVVALSAEAYGALENTGLLFQTIEDFYSEADLGARAVDANAVILELCGVLDEALGVIFDGVLPVFSASYYAGRLRVMYDALMRAAFVLDAMLECVRPQQLILFETQAPDPSEIWFDDPRFLTWVLTEMCRQRNIEHHVFTVASPPVVIRRPWGGAIRDVIRNVRDYIRSLDSAKNDIAYYFWPHKPERELLRLGIRIGQLPLSFSTLAPAVIPDLKCAARFFKFGETDLSAYVRPHLDALLGRLRSRHEACVKRIEKILSRSAARAVVAIAPLAIEPVAALVAARRLGMSAIVLQHGGFVGYCDWTQLSFTDLYINDTYLAFGPGVIETAQLMMEKRTGAIHKPITMKAIGSANIFAIHKTRGKAPTTKLRALYVSNMVTGSSRYLAGHHRPDIDYLKLKRRMLRFLARHTNDWDIHYRPRAVNGVDLATMNVVSKEIEGIDIRADVDLTTLLRTESFDLIITDAVTTVLLEVLATDVRVVACFDPVVMTLKPGAAEDLKKRADVAFSSNEFIAMTQRALHEKHRPGSVDDTFLMHYGLAGEENPSELQAKALQDILQRVPHGTILQGCGCRAHSYFR